MISRHAATILTSLADLIEVEPERWTQDAAARGADGAKLEALAPGAVCRCTATWIHVLAGSSGAVRAEADAGAYDAALEAIALMEEVIGLDGVATNLVWWNDQDERVPADVVAAARRALEGKYVA